MKKAIIILAISWLGVLSYQDSRCMQECLKQGRSFSWCVSQCSY